MKEIDRTFQERDFFKKHENQRDLKLVLVAISNRFEEVGYVQGLHSIVATLLMILDAKKSFQMIKCLFVRFELKELMTNNFPLLKLLNFQTQLILKKYNKAVYSHLVNN